MLTLTFAEAKLRSNFLLLAGGPFDCVGRIPLVGMRILVTVRIPEGNKCF